MDQETECTEHKPEAFDWLAQLLSSQIKFDQQITNQVIDNGLDYAIDWARKFEKFYQRMELAIESGNAVAAYRILGDFAWEYDRIPQAIQHYQSLKMGE